VTEFWICLAILAVVVAAIVFAVRRRRQKQAAADAAIIAAAEATHASRLAELNLLLNRIEQDDESAYKALNELVPGLGKYDTWRNFGSSHAAARYYPVVAAYERRRDLRRLGPPLLESTAMANDPSLRTVDRLRAIVRAVETLKKTIWQDYGSELPGYISLEDAETLRKELMTQHVEELALQAKTDPLAFQELRDLRLECGRYTSNQVSEGYEPIGFAYATQEGWIFPKAWRQLVSQYIKAPSVWDFGAKSEYQPSEFVHDLVNTLRTGDQADAKLFRAYLLESRDLYKVTPGQLISAVYVFAETGNRPQLDLVFATEVTQDELR
jgi:hypothetical protein